LDCKGPSTSDGGIVPFVTKKKRLWFSWAAIIAGLLMAMNRLQAAEAPFLNGPLYRIVQVVTFIIFFYGIFFVLDRAREK
jgi:hypothetical protein